MSFEERYDPESLTEGPDGTAAFDTRDNFGPLTSELTEDTKNALVRFVYVYRLQETHFSTTTLRAQIEAIVNTMREDDGGSGEYSVERDGFKINARVVGDYSGNKDSVDHHFADKLGYTKNVQDSGIRAWVIAKNADGWQELVTFEVQQA